MFIELKKTYYFKDYFLNFQYFTKNSENLIRPLSYISLMIPKNFKNRDQAFYFISV